MDKVFQIGKKYRCPGPNNGTFSIEVVARTENTVSFVLVTKNNNDKHIYTHNIILLNEALSEGFSVIPAYKTETLELRDNDGEKHYVYATDFSEAEMNMRRDKIASWKERNITDNEKDMLKLLNILDAHGENLKTLQEFVAYGEDSFCGFLWVDLPETEREVAELLFDHHRFYQKWDELLTACVESCIGTDMTFEEFMQGEDIRKTADGYVRVLHY